MAKKKTKKVKAKSKATKVKFGVKKQSAREKMIGQSIGYRYDVNLLPDYSKITPFLKKYIQEHFQKELTYPSKPIEYRIYKNSSQSMGWHQDIQYLNHPYLECIFILDNSSYCNFYYIKNRTIHSYLQKENDFILLKPRDLIHNIDPIKNNSKEILKCIIDL